MRDFLRLSFGTKLAFFFLLFGIPWILIGDFLVGENLPPSVSLQTTKGILFVFISSLFLKLVSDRMNNALRRTERHNIRVQSMLQRAEALGRLGSWQRDTLTGEEIISPTLTTILGGEVSDACGIEDLLAQSLHPDDRSHVLAERKAWRERGGHFESEYRIVTAGGDVRWLEEVAEFDDAADGNRRMVTGSIIDVTKLKSAQFAYNSAQQEAVWQQKLIRMAAEKASFGGWRYELGADFEIWSEGASAIRELPEGTEVSVAEAMSYYVAEDQRRIANYLEDCLTHGKPFDDVFQLKTAKGKQRRVRTIGEAEFDESGQIVAAQGAIQDVTELFEAREEVASQNAELQSVVASIGDGFFTLDKTWRCTFINRYALDLLHLNREDLEGKIFWDVFPRARGAIFEAKVCKAIDTGESRRFVDYAEAVGKWFEVHVHPTPFGIAVYFSDITDQRVTQDWLELLEQAVKHLNDMVMIGRETSDGAEILYVNSSFEAGLGFQREELQGQAPWFLAEHETAQATISNIIDAHQAGEASREEILARRKDGTLTWLELTSTPVSGKNEEVQHWVVILRDITERKQNAEKLAQSEERFRLISRASSDVIWDWNLQTGDFWLSENYEEVFKKTIEAEPQTFDASIARIHPEDQSRIRESLVEAVRGRGTSWQAEYRVSTGTEEYKIVEDRAFIIRDADGKAVRMVAGMTDVTEIRKLDQQLHEAQKLESIGQLTGGVAHDFNNLLTIILGNADMILEQSRDETIRNLAEITLDAAERGAHLTDNLLTFARRQPLKPETTNVNKLIKESITLLQKSVEEGVDITFDLAAMSAVVNVDSSRLQSAILNLVINSRYAVGERGGITIQTEDAFLDRAYASQHAGIAPGHYISISVTDDGSGMSPKVVEKAFEPFFTTRAPGEGTGLGLSSVYGFVKQSGGHSRIYSEPGAGTTVRLYLPVVVDGDTLEASEPEPIDLKGNGEQILVVEDDDSLRANVTTRLEGLGYLVRAAADADEALGVLDATPCIDLMFTDVVMPGRFNGRELAEEAQQRCPGLRVLFTSGYSRHAMVRNGKLEDGLQLLSKPYRLADMARALREALDD